MPSQQVKPEHVFPRSLHLQRATLRCAQVIVGQEMRRLQERKRSVSTICCSCPSTLLSRFMDFGIRRSCAAIKHEQVKGVPDASQGNATYVEQ
jgi:hypothetical protein